MHKARVLAFLLVFYWPATVFAQETVAEPFGFRSVKFNNNAAEDVISPYKYRGNPLFFSGMQFWPAITLGQDYQSNIFAVENNTENDWVTSLTPSLLVKKEWGRHEASLLAETEIRRYWETTSENIENYHTEAEIELEASSHTIVPISASYSDGHIKRISQRRLNTADLSQTPLRIKSAEGEIGVRHTFNRLGIEVIGHTGATELINNINLAGTTIVRDNKNKNTYGIETRLAYELPSHWTPFIGINWDKEDYTNEAASSITRNNSAVQLLAGSLFNYKGLLYGQFGTGWEKRSYTSHLINDAKGLVIQTQIAWEPQVKTKIIGSLERSNFEDNEIVAGITKTAASIELKHELQHNLFFNAYTQKEKEDFTDSTREDDNTNMGLGLYYIAGPHLQLSADYRYTGRDSTVTGLDMDSHIYMIHARYGF